MTFSTLPINYSFAAPFAVEQSETLGCDSFQLYHNQKYGIPTRWESETADKLLAGGAEEFDVTIMCLTSQIFGGEWALASEESLG